MTKLQEMGNGIEFTEEGHKYMYGSMQLPSVSEIISPLVDFSMVRPDILQHASQRGTDVHFAVEKYITYEWVSKLETDAQPYFQQFLAYMENKDRKDFVCETIGYNKTYNYCGTLDLIRTDKNGDMHLIDVKTSASVDTKTCTAQLTGYDLIARSHGVDFKTHTILHLTPESYKEYNIKMNNGIFLSLLAIHNYKKGK